MTFAYNKLKQLRDSKNLSQEDLVYELRNHDLKISRMTLSRWENSESSPNVKELAIIADYFKKPVKYFFS